MNIQTLSDHSKIWVYLSNRRFIADELIWLNQSLNKITQNWKAHGTPLRAGYAIEYDQIIVLAVDEAQEPASGCSIDSVVHQIQAIERALDVQLFNRMNIPVLTEGRLEILNRQTLIDRITDGTLKDSDSMIDLTITLLGDWRSSRIKSVRDSWAARWLPKFNLLP